MTTAGRVVLAFAVVVLLTACASAPTAPSVLVVAGSGKTWEQFRADDETCRQSASAEIQTKQGGNVPAQRRYDMVYMQCMYAKGHQIPTPGAPRRTSSDAVPPGTRTAAPVAWPPTPDQINCERSGGVWRAALDFCEFPSPDRPFRRWR